jgi:CRP-like cAMP-binding protein
MVVSGRFAARGTTALGDVVTYALFGPSDFFGELALLDGVSTRTATVVALEGGETLTLSRDIFETLRRTHPGTDNLLVEALAVKVRQTSAALMEALYQRAEVRVVRRLAAAAELWGALAEPGGSVRITQDDLAGLAGTTRATANRVLRDVERMGIVRTHRGRVEILDPVGLCSRARSC